MFTILKSFCSNIWQALVNPTIRLKGEFPWTFGKMTKEYFKATGLYILGSLVPLVAFIALEFGLAAFDRPLLMKLMGEHMEHVNVIILVVTIASFLCGFGLEVWYINRVLRREGHSLRKIIALNLDSLGGSWWSAIWRAAVTVALALGIQQLLQFLPQLPTPHQGITDFISTLSGVNLVAFALLASVAAPFFEEVVFRGFLFNMLRTQFNRGRIGKLLRSQSGADWAASIVSGAMFAAAHMEPSAFLGLFVFGVLLAQLYRRSGSLVCPMLAHCINNTLATVIFLLPHLH